MIINVNIAGKIIKISMKGQMKLEQLLDQIFVECDKLGISNEFTPDTFLIDGFNHHILKQDDLGKAILEVGITGLETIIARKQGAGPIHLSTASAVKDSHNLSWTTLLQYVTCPDTENIAIASRLLKTKIKDFKEDSCGNTLLHFLARSSELGLTDKDLKGNKHLNFQNKSLTKIQKRREINEESYENTPLHLAAFTGNEANVRKLLEHKADVKIKNANGSTALHMAVLDKPLSAAHLGVVSLLLAAGAPVDAVDSSLCSPMHKLCQRGSSMQGDMKIENIILAQFIGALAKINIQDKYGWTPLHHAVNIGELSTVQILVFAGANLQIENNSYRSPVDSTQHLDTVKYLVKNGAIYQSRGLLEYYNKSYIYPLFEELQYLLFKYLNQPLASFMPQALIKIIEQYASLHEETNQQILAIAHQRREYVFGPLFRQAKEKSKHTEIRLKISSLYDTLMQSDILLEKEIKKFLIDRVIKNINVFQNLDSYLFLYIAIAEVVGKDNLIEAIQLQNNHPDSKHNRIMEVIEFIQNGLPSDGPIVEPRFDEDYFSPDRNSNPLTLSDYKLGTLYPQDIKTPDRKAKSSLASDNIEEPIPVTVDMVRDTIKDLMFLNQAQFNRCSPPQKGIDAAAIKEISTLTNFNGLRSWLIRYWSIERSNLLNRLLLKQMEDPLIKTNAKEVYSFLGQLSSALESAPQPIKNTQPLVGAASASLAQVGWFKNLTRSTEVSPAAIDAGMLEVKEMRSELLAIAKVLQKDVDTIQQIGNLQSMQEIRDFYEPDVLAGELKQMQGQMNLISKSERGPAFERIINCLKSSFNYIAKLKKLVEQENEHGGYERKRLS